MYKMTGDLYEDVILVNDAICQLIPMIEMLEKECMARDKDKVASELFVLINTLKRDMNKIPAHYDKIMQRADIDRYGTLSKYARPYLGF